MLTSNKRNETTSEGVKHPDALLLDSSLISQYKDVERRIIYDVKIIHCGDTIQIYKFDKTRSKENKKDRDTTPKVSIKNIDTDNLYKESRVEEVKPILLQNAIRSNLNCQRICKANREEWESFITLTFKENIIDIAYANRIFSSWVSNIRKLKKDFKYIAVPEFQKRGAVHYHILSNLGKEDNMIILPQKEKTGKAKNLSTLFDVKYWSKGFARVDFIKNDYKKIYSYICKYMTKDIDNKLFGKHRYFNSQNLNKPNIEFLDLNNEKDLKYFTELTSNYSIDYNSHYRDIYSDNDIEFIELTKTVK